MFNLTMLAAIVFFRTWFFLSSSKSGMCCHLYKAWQAKVFCVSRKHQLSASIATSCSTTAGV